MNRLKNLIGFLIVVAFLVGPIAMVSAAVVDTEVEAAIENGESAIPVIVTLRTSQEFEDLLAQDLPRERRIKTLQARATQSLNFFIRTIKLPVNNYREYWIFNGFAITATADEIDAFAYHPAVESIEYDEQVSLNPVDTLDGTPRGEWTYGLEKMGIPAIRSQLNLDGTGVVVGVIDSGVDVSHPDLRGKVVGFKDFVNNKKQPYDDQGHGSHCCGTIVGGNASGTQIGVAPNAKLIVAKAFSDTGSTQTSWLLAAMQYMADPDGKPSTDDAPSVVSNSWGGSGTSTKYLDATKQWLALGILPAFAAGNKGSSPRTVGTPGSYLESFAIGATRPDDKIASFSSRGPVTWGNIDYIKPDVSAPGKDIYSVRAGGGYTKKSGTSMACPHIAGVIALIHQASPGISINDVRQLLEGTSKDLGIEGKDNDFGYGRVNAFAAAKIAVSGGRITGRLTQSDNNRPLEGIVTIVEKNIQIKVGSSGEFSTTLVKGTYHIVGSAYGFVDSSPLKVRVQSGGHHKVSVKLRKAVAGSILGKVRAADGGVVVNAKIRVLDTSVATVATNGSFKLTLPAGTYRLMLTAFGYAATFVDGVVVTSSATTNMTVKMNDLPPVLLVDDDIGKRYEKYYKRSLDALGVSYDYINVKDAGQLEADEVIAYENVIWFTGKDYKVTLTQKDQKILDEYLRKGGSLILAGQDIAYDIKRSNLLNKVLKVTFKDDDSGQKIVKGLGQSVSIKAGPIDQILADRCQVVKGGEILFTYEDGTCGGVFATTYAGKSAFCAFGFEGITNDARPQFIAALLNKVALTEVELINRVRLFETEEHIVRYAELHAFRLVNLTDEELMSLHCDLNGNSCRSLSRLINGELSNR